MGLLFIYIHIFQINTNICLVGGSNGEEWRRDAEIISNNGDQFKVMKNGGGVLRSYPTMETNSR